MLEYKNHILAWLPVMKELEEMGYNPVKLIFSKSSQLRMNEIEAAYVAISRCKVKYPKWYEVMSEYVAKIMNPMEELCSTL